MVISDFFPSKRCQSPLSPVEVYPEVLDLFKNGIMIREICPFCGHVLSMVKQLAAYDYRGYPCASGICSSCQGVFQFKHLTEDALKTNYEQFSTKVRGIDTSSFEKRRELFLKRSNSFANERYLYLRPWMTKPKVSVVEIGCNDGANLYPFYLNGHETVGFDLDAQSIEVGKSFNLKLYAEDCFKYLEKNQVDVIILSHFLEHLISPLDFLISLKTYLKEETLLFVEVPGLRHSSWVNWKIGILPYFQYEHLQCFDAKLLTHLMHRAGLYPLDCDEYVRGIFAIKKVEISKNINRDQGCGDFLYDVEKKWQDSMKRKVYTFLSQIKNLLTTR